MTPNFARALVGGHGSRSDLNQQNHVALPCRFVAYSYLSVSNGSTRVARRAGK
jgi:hypothetical protein